jgi:thiaminase
MIYGKITNNLKRDARTAREPYKHLISFYLSSSELGMLEIVQVLFGHFRENFVFAAWQKQTSFRED